MSSAIGSSAEQIIGRSVADEKGLFVTNCCGCMSLCTEVCAFGKLKLRGERGSSLKADCYTFAKPLLLSISRCTRDDPHNPLNYAEHFFPFSASGAS